MYLNLRILAFTNGSVSILSFIESLIILFEGSFPDCSADIMNVFSSSVSVCVMSGADRESMSACDISVYFSFGLRSKRVVRMSTSASVIMIIIDTI